MSKKSGNNIFTVLLNALGVPYTRKFASKLYGEHPHKNNMFGLSKMLFDYQVPNEGVMLKDQKDIISVEPPFIAQFNNDLVVAEKITADEVHVFGTGQNIKIPIEKFIEGCSGAILVAEPDKNSIEPKYKENKRSEIFRGFLKYALIAAVCAVILFSVIRSHIFLSPGLMAVLVLNLVGVYIGYLLVKKQFKLNSTAADKICSMFNKKSDCSNVLESKASKLFGIIGWSELGLSYFISNTLLVLFFPEFIPYLALLSVCALPYTVWSVWYQKVKAKQWCPLCLIVQGLFILLFVSNLAFGFIQWPSFLPADVTVLVFIYLLPFLIIMLLLPALTENENIEQVTYKLNSLKMNESVFQALLKEQSYYEITPGLSKIRFGNPDAETLITVVSNPHCNPCSMVHPGIDKLMSALGEQVCVQFLFLNFPNENTKNSGKFLISAYLNKGEKEAKEILNRWFAGEKDSAPQVYEKYNINLDADDVVAEQKKHEDWCDNNKISSTPTILVNGYRLPDNYRIDDLIYI